MTLEWTQKQLGNSSIISFASINIIEPAGSRSLLHIANSKNYIISSISYDLFVLDTSFL